MEGKKGISEDWLSLWLGFFIVVLGLALFVGLDVLGWGVKTNVWTDITKAISPISGTFKGMPGLISLLLTYIFMTVVMGIGAIALKANFGKFMLGFTLVFWMGYGCWLLGHFGYIASTNAAKDGIGWSLKLTGEAGFIVALIVGLIVGNFFPKLAGTLKEATRPELYIKTAIVIMGAGLGVKAAEAAGLASAVLFRGLCAIVEAYLIYWAVVYFVARKYFKFSREWAAPPSFGDLDLRRLRGHRHRRRHPGPARGAYHGLLPGGHLRGGGIDLAAICGPNLPVYGAHGGRGLDGTGGQDRRGRSGVRRHCGFFDPGQGPGGPRD